MSEVHCRRRVSELRKSNNHVARVLRSLTIQILKSHEVTMNLVPVHPGVKEYDQKVRR